MTEVAERFADHAVVVLVEPVLELLAGNLDDEVVALLNEERGRAKPGGETMPVDLLLDPAEDLIPEVHHRQPRR